MKQGPPRLPSQSMQRKQGSQRLPSERKPPLTSVVPLRTSTLRGDRSFPRHNSPTRSDRPIHQTSSLTSSTGINGEKDALQGAVRLPQYPTEARSPARSRYKTDSTPSPRQRQRKPTMQPDQLQTAFRGPELSRYLQESYDRNQPSQIPQHVLSSSDLTSVKPTIPRTSDKRSRNQRLPLFSTQSGGFSSSTQPSHQSEGLPADTLYPQQSEGSSEQNPSQLMCYWCAIKIVQENTFDSSGPNHMPIGIGTQPFAQQIPVNVDSKPVPQFDNVGFRRSNNDVRIQNLHDSVRGGAEITDFQSFDLPSTVSAEFRANDERTLWNPQTSSSHFNPLLSSFNRILSEQRIPNKTNLKPGPFFKPLTPRINETSVSLVETFDGSGGTEVDQNLSAKLSTHLPTYLEHLSSVHGLYPSALSAADTSKHLAETGNSSASVALLHSDPLKTYLYSVDTILQKNIHQGREINPKLIESQEPETSAREDQTSVANSLQKNDVEVGHPHVQKSLLLDAWWRLRLYLHVGHEHPWVQE